MNWKPKSPLFNSAGPLLRSLILDQPITGDTWLEEEPALVAHHFSRFAISCEERGEVSIPDEVRKRLQYVARCEAMDTLAVRANALDVFNLLDTNHVQFVVIKGPGLAKLYSDESCRPYGDIDILVDKNEYRKAMALLTNAGYWDNNQAQPRNYFDYLCREGVNLINDRGSSIDVHQVVPPWAWGRKLSFSSVYQNSYTDTIGKNSVRIASDVDNIIIVSLHLLSDKGRPGQSLRVWRDLVICARSVDPAQLRERLNRTGIAWWVVAMLRELPDPATQRLASQIEDGSSPSVFERLRLHIMLPPSVGSRHSIGIAFRLPIFNALAFLAGHLMPSRKALQQRSQRSAFANLKSSSVKFQRVRANRDQASYIDLVNNADAMTGKKK